MCFDMSCRDAFGWGQVCGEAGLCEPVTPHPRCDRTVPSDLLQEPEAYADYVILGSLYDDVAFSLEVQSIELAVRQVNDNGGLQGREYAFVHCTNMEHEDFDKLEVHRKDGRRLAKATWDDETKWFDIDPYDPTSAMPGVAADDPEPTRERFSDYGTDEDED